MLPKELEATEQMSMEKLMASETLQTRGKEKRDFKANQNQPNKNKQASMYTCIDVINIAKHICLFPQVSKDKIANAPKHQPSAMKMLMSAKHLQAN